MQILLGLCITLSVVTGPKAADAQKTAIGKTVANFKLENGPSLFGRGVILNITASHRTST
jgi:hypothetical protein